MAIFAHILSPHFPIVQNLVTPVTFYFPIFLHIPSSQLQHFHIFHFSPHGSPLWSQPENSLLASSVETISLFLLTPVAPALTLDSTGGCNSGALQKRASTRALGQAGLVLIREPSMLHFDNSWILINGRQVSSVSIFFGREVNRSQQTSAKSRSVRRCMRTGRFFSTLHTNTPYR